MRRVGALMPYGANDATRNVPIVFVNVADPVGARCHPPVQVVPALP
jgi:hypothetical protein